MLKGIIIFIVIVVFYAVMTYLINSTRLTRIKSEKEVKKPIDNNKEN